jgi:hypothetical protein
MHVGLCSPSHRGAQNGHHIFYRRVDLDHPKDPLILAVGRWWDEGKNGAILDEAATSLPWPIVLAGRLSGLNG